MKHSIAVLIALSCVLASFNVARADDNALRAAFQTYYARVKLAMLTHDDKAMQALLAPGFISIDVSGQTEGAAQMIGEVDSLPKDLKKVSTTTLLSLKASGNTAIVTQRYDMKTVKLAADGSNEDVELVTLSTDTWVTASGTWALQKTETDQLDYYVNGQQVAHKVRPQ
jgi:hypothetical protein